MLVVLWAIVWSCLSLMSQQNFSIDQRHSTTIFARQIRGLMLFGVVIAIFVAGCSKERFPRDPNMVPISGTVTIDGEPTPNVRVIFAKPQDVADFKVRKRRVLDGFGGVTDEKGAFSATSVHKNDGLLPGDYTVVFGWNPSGMDPELFFDGNVPTKEQLKGLPPKLMQFHDKYCGKGSGSIDFKVEAGKPQKDVKFDLTTK